MWLIAVWDVGCLVGGGICRQTSALIAVMLAPVSTKNVSSVSQTVPLIETLLVSRDSAEYRDLQEL